MLWFTSQPIAEDRSIINSKSCGQLVSRAFAANWKTRSKPAMATRLSKPILQHSRTGKEGSSMSGDEASTAPETLHGAFPTGKGSRPKAPCCPDWRSPDWRKARPTALAHKTIPKYGIHLSPEGCSVVLKSPPFIILRLHWQIDIRGSVSISTISTLRNSFLNIHLLLFHSTTFHLNYNLFKGESFKFFPISPCMLVKVTCLKSWSSLLV